MNISPNFEIKNKYNKKQKPAFKGRNILAKAFASEKTTSALKLIENPIAGLLFINFTTLMAPRIYLDAKRNRYAGQETAFYESFGTFVNYGLAGSVALATASLLNKINNPLKIDLKGWIKNDTAEALGNLYKNSLKGKNKAENAETFIRNALRSIEGYDGVSKDASNNQIWKRFSDNTENIERLTQRLKEMKKPDRKAIHEIAHSIGETVGAYDNIRIKIPQKNGKTLSINLEKFLKNILYTGREFEKAYNTGTTDAIKLNVDKIVKKIISTNKIKTALGLGLVCSLGYSAQFINRWITKKQTGKNDFVGYKDFKPEENSNSNASKKVSFSGFESSQFLPTVDALKFPIYPAGMIGKIAASRNKDEFRESTSKCIYASLNFLFIPSLIANIAANAFKNKHVFSNWQDKPVNSSENIFKKAFSWLKKINGLKVRSYEDIQIYSGKLSKELAGLEEKKLAEKLGGIFKTPNLIIEKIKNMNPEQKQKELANIIRVELNKIKNISKVAGIGYAFATLGVAINVINIVLTDNLRKKELEKHKGKEISEKNDNQIKLDAINNFLKQQSSVKI